VLVLVLVVYPLSVGPAVVAELRLRRPKLEVVMVIYWPLIALSEVTQSQLLQFYCNWWLKSTGGDPRYSP
jgi:hypothetical protein